MIKNRPYVFLIITFFFFVFATSLLTAQSIPPFKMLLTNGKTFYAKDLSHQKPVIIIYFSPDCEHCQTLMNGVFNKINNFKGAEIIMITFNPLNEVVKFEKYYHTYKYPNIIVGTEVPALFLRSYYNLVKTPFTALYDRMGQYIYSYKQETSIDDLVKRLKMLK